MEKLLATRESSNAKITSSASTVARRKTFAGNPSGKIAIVTEQITVLDPDLFDKRYERAAAVSPTSSSKSKVRYQ